MTIDAAMQHSSDRPPAEGHTCKQKSRLPDVDDSVRPGPNCKGIHSSVLHCTFIYYFGAWAAADRQHWPAVSNDAY